MRRGLVKDHSVSSITGAMQRFVTQGAEEPGVFQESQTEGKRLEFSDSRLNNPLIV